MCDVQCRSKIESAVIGSVTLVTPNDFKFSKLFRLASPSGPLPSFDQMMSLGPKMAPPRGHMFYIGLYRENMKKSSCLKPQIFRYTKLYDLDIKPTIENKLKKQLMSL